MNAPTQPSEGETPRSEHIQALLACQPITAAPHAILVIGELRAQLQALQSAARKVVEAQGKLRFGMPAEEFHKQIRRIGESISVVAALLPSAPPPSVPTE